MFKIELENRDFCKSLYFYIVDAGKKKKKKKKRAASGCWRYIKSRANIKWTLEKIWAAALASALIYILVPKKLFGFPQPITPLFFYNIKWSLKIRVK